MFFRASRLSVLTCLMMLPFVGSAGAEVRSGAVHDGIDSQRVTPSLNGPDPVEPEITRVAASYDSLQGSINVSVTFNFGPPRVVYVSLGDRDTCAEREGSVPKLSIELSTSPESDSEPVGNDNMAGAELEGFEGRVVAPEHISADGRTVSTTVSHSQFKNRDWRCVYGGGFTSEGQLDRFEFYFTGYGPKSLTATTALPFLKQELSRRYGAGWETPGSWSACPREEFFPEGRSGERAEPEAFCEFRFKAGRKWRHGTMVLAEENDEISVAFASSRFFVKALRTCKPLRTLRTERIFGRRLRAGGWVGCADNPASFIRDLHRLKPGVRRVGFRGTNRAGFEDAVTFRCVLRAHSRKRRSATCSNKLGDRFVYKFRLGS